MVRLSGCGGSVVIVDCSLRAGCDGAPQPVDWEAVLVARVAAQAGGVDAVAGVETESRRGEDVTVLGAFMLAAGTNRRPAT
jgi:hypothetical protein